MIEMTKRDVNAGAMGNLIISARLYTSSPAHTICLLQFIIPRSPSYSPFPNLIPVSFSHPPSLIYCLASTTSTTFSPYLSQSNSHWNKNSLPKLSQKRLTKEMAGTR
uniref:Uncharacterized protein n=1 Tax=Cacopsylla melanoneura TaxID=428564 RepID=A0A8D8ZJW1_9HEMI